MKRFIFLLVFLLLVGSVFAGNILTLDFTNQSSYNVAFHEGDGIRFNFRDQDNKIVVREIRPERGQVDVTVFVEGSSVPFYHAVSSKYKIDLDFDRDDVKDMEIRLFNLRDNETAVLVVEALNSFEAEEKKIVFDIEKNFDPKNWGEYFRAYLLYIILALLVLLLLVVERRTILRSYRRIKRGFRI